MKSTAQCIAGYASQTPDAPVVVTPHQSITYANLVSDLIRVRLWLDRLPIRPGMIVGIATPHRYTHLLVALVCEVIGATTTTLTANQCRPDDVVFPFCDVLLTSEPELAERTPHAVLISAGWLDTIPPEEALTAGPVVLEREIPAGEVARIIRTSGSTGRSKAMPIPYGIQQARIARTLGRVERELAPHPSYFTIYPLGVDSEYLRCLGVLCRGGTVHLGSEATLHACIASGVINYARFSVGDCARFIALARPPPPGHHFHLEVFGAALAPAMRQRLRQGWNAVVSSRYSSNETHPVAITDEDNVGTVCEGVEVRIVDAAGRDLPPGETGLIRVKSDAMVPGYFNDPEMTAASFIDGWFQTGDLGMVPAPGKLVVLGRADEMLNIGGIKFSPLPIEAEVKEIDGVNDAAALRIDDDNAGGTLVIAVEIGDRPLDEALARRIEAVAFQYVRTFLILPMPDFPRSASHKVLRRQIEAAFRDRNIRRDED